MYETRPGIPVSQIQEEIFKATGIKIPLQTIYKRAKRKGWQRTPQIPMDAKPILPPTDSDEPEDTILSKRMLKAIQKGIETDQVLAQAAKGSLGWHLRRDFAIRQRIDTIEAQATKEHRALTPDEVSQIRVLHSKLLKIADLIRIAQITMPPGDQIKIQTNISNVGNTTTNNDNRVQIIVQEITTEDMKKIRANLDNGEVE